MFSRLRTETRSGAYVRMCVCVCACVCRKVVDALLDSLPNTFAANNTHTADSCMGPALQVRMIAARSQHTWHPLQSHLQPLVLTTSVCVYVCVCVCQAAMMAMQHVGGKLHLFQAAVPNLGVGRIKNREQANVYGTDRESSLRQPEDAFYKRYASEASRNQVSTQCVM